MKSTNDDKVLIEREKITNAAAEVGIPLVELSPDERYAVREALLARYGNDPHFEFDCHNIADRVSLQHPDGWRWIEEFAADPTVLLFYDSSWDTPRRPDRSMFRVPGGKDLGRLLDAFWGTVYYVTDESLSYVLCFSDDDYLIGTGTAKAWVESLQPRHDEWAATLGAGAHSQDD